MVESSERKITEKQIYRQARPEGGFMKIASLSHERSTQKTLISRPKKAEGVVGREAEPYMFLVGDGYS